MHSIISKEQYISVAHKIMQEEGIQAITIRRLGNELGCNTANLYRYFRDLDELIVYSSLGYLRGYLKEINDLLKKDMNTLELHYSVWECFARHSFANAEIFNSLFFGKHGEHLDVIMKDYYNLFGEEIESLDAETRKIFTSGDFRYRDYLMISRAVEEGYFRPEDKYDLNHICIYLYKGYLKEIMDHHISGEDVLPWKENFMKHLRKILQAYTVQVED